MPFNGGLIAFKRMRMRDLYLKMKDSMIDNVYCACFSKAEDSQAENYVYGTFV